FMLYDYQVEGYQLFDIRGKKGIDVKPVTSNIAYLVFNEEHRSMVTNKNTKDIFIANHIDIERLNSYSEVVVVDCPYKISEAKAVFSQLDVNRIYFRVQVSTEHYMTGLPSREQFSRLFKFVATSPSIDVRYKLDDMAKYLKIEKKLLIFMINVFFDLGFVTIEDGLMAKVDQPINKPLQESKIYQEYEEKIEMEKLFLYSNINEIKEWILQQEEVK
ncbi:single-stranded-DNA-specific exonuclease C-terminal domain-containing protein, partial [Acinetobacter baumannii]|nr:single-stranded-DNA-specific exonuclease C-terminal domain-containing protein [Acinetobacter baumannii]